MSAHDPNRSSAGQFCCDAQRCPLVGFAINGATLHEKIVDTRVNFFAPSLERSVERERVERRLTAILMADVVGYSRLMGADDEATLAQLKAHQDALVAPKIKEHRGRIVRRWAMAC
jgi:class 3 adenylate cyclase